MSSEDILELVEWLGGIDVACADPESCTEVLQGLSRLIAWSESTKVAVAKRLAVIAAESPAICPEHLVATATRVSLGQALEPFKRAIALDAFPQFGEALECGEVSAAHDDVLVSAVGKLDIQERERFETRGDFLADVARHTTPGEFARTVRAELLRSRQGDGLERLRQQKQATYLKSWVDQTSGMWCINGEFDPETGVGLHNRLTATVERLFHDTTPETAPRDPLAKQHHLRALALVALVDGSGGKSNGVDMSILIDATTLMHGVHDCSVIDCGLPIDLPIDTIRRMACIADITPIIVGADGVKLYLGNATRLATPEQRRALRAMYRTCAVPGCCVAWDNVVIHHIKYYRNRGPTDIDNLLPLCVKHHHCAHEGGWQFNLAVDRNLTITLPDGTVSCHSPPTAFAA